MNRTAELVKKIREDVYDFFSDQCEVELGELNDNTKIIDDIDGDSLMFLQMMENWKKEYEIDIDFRKIGRYLTKNPVETLGDAVELALQLICDGDRFKESLK